MFSSDVRSTYILRYTTSYFKTWHFPRTQCRRAVRSSASSALLPESGFGRRGPSACKSEASQFTCCVSAPSSFKVGLLGSLGITALQGPGAREEHRRTNLINYSASCCPPDFVHCWNTLGQRDISPNRGGKIIFVNWALAP